MRSPVFLYIVTVLSWGSTWYVVKFQVEAAVPELQSIAWRFGLAALVFWGLVLIRGKGVLPRLRWQDHLGLAAQGLLLFGLNYLLFYLSTQDLPATGLVAVLFSTMTVMNIVNQALFFGRKVTGRTGVATLLGLLGIGIIFWDDLQTLSLDSAELRGLLLALAGAYSASLGNMASLRNSQAGIPVDYANAHAMSLGALACLALHGLADGRPLTLDLTWPYLLSLGYLVMIGSVLGFAAYLTLLRQIGPDRAAYSTVLFPVVALVISTLFEDFHWSLNAGIGVALTLAGVLVLIARKRPEKA